MDATILYEDAALLLALKPPGVISEDSGMPQLLRGKARAENPGFFAPF